MTHRCNYDDGAFEFLIFMKKLRLSAHFAMKSLKTRVQNLKKMMENERINCN